jgi:hypothetical protein
MTISWVAMHGYQVAAGEDDGVAAESRSRAEDLAASNQCDRPVEAAVVVDQDVRDVAALLRRAEDENLVLKVAGGVITAYKVLFKWHEEDIVEDGLVHADAGDFVDDVLSSAKGAAA